MKRFYRIQKQVGIEVLKRHNNRCAQCGTESNLCVHHIVRVAVTDERYNDIDNMVVLCKSCHMSHHRKEGDIQPPASSFGNPYGRRGKVPPIYCSIEGCGKPQYGRRLCKKHYEYARIHKNL